MKRCSFLFKRSFAICLITLLVGCSSNPQLESDAVPPMVKMPEKIDEVSLVGPYSDPWEGFNRRMYYFNAKADEYILLPVASGYKAIIPDFIESGISNFFSNLGEIPTFINSVLQFKGKVALETLSRFALNSTIGIAGLIDVATPVGLEEQNEDFGQTLGYWGVEPGPYVVLPLLGPSSLRDSIGAAVDMVAYQAAVNELGMKDEEELFLSFLSTVNTRANLPFRYYASGSAFEYEKIKLLYMKYREIQIAR